jgi:hypothetical protein
MKYLLPFIGLVMSLSSFCQELKWETGVLVNKEKEVLVGSLIYYPMHDAVLLREQAGHVGFFSSRQISSFRFYDAKADINRQFFSFAGNDAVPAHSLMEIVLNGSVKVVRRLKFHHVELTTANDAEEFTYYVLLDETLLPLRQFRSKVLPVLLKKFPAEITSLVTENRNERALDAVAIQIIKEYNRLDTKLALVASTR